MILRSVAFLDVFADIVPPLLNTAAAFQSLTFLTSRTVLLIIATLCLLVPVVTTKAISGFIIASLVSSVCAIVFATHGAVLALVQAPVGSSPVETFPLHNPANISPTSIFSALSIIPLSWTCQFNVLPIFNCLKNATVQRMRTVIVCSMLIAVSTYILFGLAAYERYPSP